jgi:AcrR family transcriptional regulator
MKENTREKFLVTTKQMFAARGFYSTSIANISEELGITKQALLHHFGSKEKLYAEIVQEISDHSMSILTTAQDTTAEAKFKIAQGERHSQLVPEAIFGSARIDAQANQKN